MPDRLEIFREIGRLRTAGAIPAPRENKRFFLFLCGDRGERALFDDHSRVVDGFKQESDSPAIVALALDLADPALKRALLDLDVIARSNR